MKGCQVVVCVYWQGQIWFVFVLIFVEIYFVIKLGVMVLFKQIYELLGQLIYYDKVVIGVGFVDIDEIMKGYEVVKGEYVLFDQDEIDVVKLELKKMLEFIQFVDVSEIDVFYYEKFYFVVLVDDFVEEVFIVLCEVLWWIKKVGFGQFVMCGCEYVVSLKLCGCGMVLEMLCYVDEVYKV